MPKLYEVVSGKDRVWLVTSHSLSKDLIITKLIDKGYTLNETDLNKITIYLFEKEQ